MGNAASLFPQDPSITPNYYGLPSHDPNYGFQNTRKERVMVATEAEMESARLPHQYRDYCAHKLIDYHVCRRKVFPMLYQCAHERHDYLNCEYEDYVMRAKEFERERRLLERAKRKGIIESKERG